MSCSHGRAGSRVEICHSMLLASNSIQSPAMTGSSRPQQFRLSLSFLNRKKKMGGHLEQECSGSGHDSSDPPDGVGDNLQDIAEENEEHLYQNRADLIHNNAFRDAENAGRNIEKLALAVVPKSLPALDVVHKDLSIVNMPISFRSYDMAYPQMSPPGKKTLERSSTRAFDSSTRSSSLRMEGTSQKFTGSFRKGWLSKRCGFKSCSKQIDMEAKLRSKDSSGHGDKLPRRSQRSRTKSMTGITVLERGGGWGNVTKGENDVAGMKVVSRKKNGYLSGKLAPSPGVAAPPLALHSARSETLTDACEEVRQAARYEIPAHHSDQRQGAADAMDSVQGNHIQETSTDVDGNLGEDRVHPWDRSFSSSSSDEELFTTSLEQDGQSKSRRKQWSSYSSDDDESRHRRPASSHARSRSTRTNQSARSLEQDDEIVGNRRTKGKKGSRIIFLSTPPRPKELGLDGDESMTTNHIVANGSNDCIGEYCKVASTTDSHFLKALPTDYTGSRISGFFEADMEGNSKAWSKLHLRSTLADDSVSEASVRELPIVSRSNGFGKQRLRHIGVQVEDQLVNLRLESDVSDSSDGKIYNTSQSSRRQRKGAMKLLDEEKPSKKKKCGRRKKGRKAKAPPPLPSDLHGKVKESVAVVKSSYDPYTDFRDSMVEMIVEKEIQGATDLEELLRCYLSLNAAEYHGVIVKVFADVWRQLFSDAM